MSVIDRDQLDRGFQRLNPEQRAIFILHHYLGWTQVEIARNQTVQGAVDLTLLFGGVGSLDLDAKRTMYISGLDGNDKAIGLLELTEGGDTVAFWPTPAENVAVTNAGDAIYVTSHLSPYLQKFDLPKR